MMPTPKVLKRILRGEELFDILHEQEMGAEVDQTGVEVRTALDALVVAIEALYELVPPSDQSRTIMADMFRLTQEIAKTKQLAVQSEIFPS